MYKKRVWNDNPPNARKIPNEMCVVLGKTQHYHVPLSNESHRWYINNGWQVQWTWCTQTTPFCNRDVYQEVNNPVWED